jgi:hypothetical protein
MRPLLIIAYAQHGQRSRGDYDPGAWADIDGDGMREAWEQEAKLAAAYGSLIAGMANAHGAQDLPVEGWFVGWGDDVDVLTYDRGHAAINERARAWHEQNPGGLSVVLACHCNAGGGSYGLVAWDARSALGRVAASTVAAAWEAGVPLLGRVKRTAGSSDGQPFQRRLHYCLRGAWSGPGQHCGLTLEPGFLDTVAHRGLWTTGGLEAIARATVAGLVAWADDE